MKFIVSLAACIFLLVFQSQAQVLDSALNKLATHYQPERIYIQYDKSSYTPGETIWFKAYLLDGLFPADQTKTMYVDWIDEKGNTLFHSVSPIVDGGTNGQIEVPAEFSGNFIHVRAYTQWMLNFDTAFLYNKDLHIIQKPSASTRQKPAATPSIDFFPEGGDAVAGIINRVAFMARDQFGRPVKISGFVYDEKNTIVDTLKTIHDGMGSFHYTPVAGKTYTAKWKDEKGLLHSTPLSPAKASGISMQVAVVNTKRYVSITCSANAPESMKLLHLVGTINQTMAFKTDASLTDNNSVRKIIPTEKLPSGILVLTVFNDSWEPLAERITYVNNNEYSFPTKMEVQHWGLNKRARDEVQISLPPEISANLSVAVTDAEIETDSSDHIISHFMLTGELRGNIHNPAYYFSDNTDIIAQKLDLVMLTHGWRRFNWQEVAKGNMPKLTYAKDTGYLYLGGKVVGTAKGSFGPNDNIILIVKQKDTSGQMMVLPINSKGTFGDPNMIFFDTLHVYYQLKSKTRGGAEARFMDTRFPAPDYTKWSKGFPQGSWFGADTLGYAHHLSMSLEELKYANVQKGKMLENITVRARQKSPKELLDEKYTSSLFRSGDSYNIDLINEKAVGSYVNIFQYLQGKVAGLQVSMGSMGKASVSIRGGGSPSFFLDEAPADIDMISNIPVQDIAYIKVFKNGFVGASGGGAGGTIAIYTRKGNDRPVDPNTGLANNNIAGYTMVRQFYQPNYSAFDPRNDHLDVRSTIYWNPRLIMDPKTNKATITFYNNDVTHSFRVIIEGVSKEGLLTHMEQIME